MTTSYDKELGAELQRTEREIAAEGRTRPASPPARRPAPQPRSQPARPSSGRGGVSVQPVKLRVPGPAGVGSRLLLALFLGIGVLEVVSQLTGDYFGLNIKKGSATKPLGAAKGAYVDLLGQPVPSSASSQGVGSAQTFANQVAAAQAANVPGYPGPVTVGQRPHPVS